MTTSQPRSRRQPRTVENSEYRAFARRMIRAYGRRVADGDIDALGDLQALRDEIDAAMVVAVEGLRSEKWNYSWAQIGDALGVARQAAQKRFGHVTAKGARQERVRPLGQLPGAGQSGVNIRLSIRLTAVRRPAKLDT